MNPSSDTNPETEAVIRDLTNALKPVQRLHSPKVRALCWLAVVVAIAGCLAMVADLPSLRHRMVASPDMWLAIMGSTLTAGFAAVAAFELSTPDASRAWAALPVPAMVLWIGASGAGCLRTWLVDGTHVAGLSETRDCLLFIIGLSAPLLGLLIWMIRRACSLQPELTAITAGLAAAAAAATLLNFFHPFDAAAVDLATHAAAVALVIAVNQVFSGRLLTKNPSRTT